MQRLLLPQPVLERMMRRCLSLLVVEIWERLQQQPQLLGGQVEPLVYPSRLQVGVLELQRLLPLQLLLAE